MEIISFLARECLNGIIFPLGMCFLYWTFWHLTQARLSYGPAKWLRAPGVAMACVLAWIFFADTLESGSMFIFLRAFNAHQTVSMLKFNLVLIVSGCAMVFGMLRGIYLFSRREMGHKGWIFSALFAVAFVAASQWWSHAY
jgi:hypothetical protein